MYRNKSGKIKHVPQEDVKLRLRIKREKNLYNKGAVDRSILNKLFEHANNCLSWRNQGELIRKYMVSANDKTVLEIGSTSWAGTIDFKEINPKKLICINISEKELQNHFYKVTIVS